MSGMAFLRVADKVVKMPTRLLPKTRGAGTNKSLDNTTPSLLADAMGVTPQECVLAAAVDTAATLTLWLYSKTFKVWLLAGANAGNYQKVYDANNTLDGWTVPEGVPFFIQASVEVTSCWVDGLTP